VDKFEAAARIYVEWIKRQAYVTPDEPDPEFPLALAEIGDVVQRTEYVEVDEVEEIANWVEREVRKGEPDAWTLVRDVVRYAPADDRVLSLIGAGIFETWVSEARVQPLLPELRAELLREPKLRTVVLASWDIPASLQPILRELGCWGAG
jgi:hypothetical protein